MSIDRHVVLVHGSVPHCGRGGGGVTAYSMGCAMLHAGYRLTVLALGSDSSNHTPSSEKAADHWRALGAQCILLNEDLSYRPPVRLLDRMSEVNFFPGRRIQMRVVAELRRISPGVILHYHWEALATTWGIRLWPKIGLVGDPIHLPSLFRRRFQNAGQGEGVRGKFRRRLRQLVYEPLQVRGMVAMLNECDVAGAFAAHHAAMFRDFGATQCRYFRTPVPDPGQRCEVTRGERLRILHVGHLQGIATLTGVQLLVEEVVPVLERELGVDGFEIHIVGGFVESVPMALRVKLNHPAIRIRGQVTPADEEFRAAHILIVPTPIELGIRVRIITGFSFGTAIVAHRANRAGIPELVDGTNCLLGASGIELATACVRIWREPALRATLEAQARATFEHSFSPEAAGAAVAVAVEGVLTVDRRAPTQNKAT